MGVDDTSSQALFGGGSTGVMFPTYWPIKFTEESRHAVLVANQLAI